MGEIFRLRMDLFSPCLWWLSPPTNPTCSQSLLIGVHVATCLDQKQTDGQEARPNFTSRHSHPKTTLTLCECECVCVCVQGSTGPPVTTKPFTYRTHTHTRARQARTQNAKKKRGEAKARTHARTGSPRRPYHIHRLHTTHARGSVSVRGPTHFVGVDSPAVEHTQHALLSRLLLRKPSSYQVRARRRSYGEKRDPRNSRFLRPSLPTVRRVLGTRDRRDYLQLRLVCIF